MDHPGCDLSVAIVIDKNSDQKQAIKVLRRHLPTSMSLLLQLLKKSEPVYSKLLKVSMLYDGWKEFYQLVFALRVCDIGFSINVNGEDKPANYAEDLKDLMMGVQRNDLY